MSFCYIRAFSGGNNSVVECNLAKVEVAGSNPVSRSIDGTRRHRDAEIGKKFLIFFSVSLCLRVPNFPRRRSQAVRQRSAKPLYVGSIPTAASLL